MTVLTQTNKMAPQVMNGVTTVFFFTFRALVDFPEAIQATILNTTTDVETNLVYNGGGATGYTVSIDDDGIGGSITVNSAQSASYEITIYREYDITQESNYADYNSFPAETVENDYDKLTMITQQNAETVSRAITIPITVTGVSTALPPPTADYLLAWDATATSITNIDPDSISGAAAAAASAAAASASASAASASSVSAAASAAAAAASAGSWQETTVVEKVADYSILVGDIGKTFIMSSGVARTFTLPNITVDAVYVLKNIGAATTTIAKDVSDGLDVTSLTTGQAVILVADTTNNVWRDVAKNGGSAASTVVRATFVNADLTAGVLTVTHNLALASPFSLLVSVYNNSNEQIIPDQVNTITTNSFKIDLTSFGVLAGTWSYAFAA